MGDGDDGGTQPSVQIDVIGNKVINDGLLCSILHAKSHVINAEDLIGRIERACDLDVILESRKKLFTFYSDVTCSERNKLILDIERQSKRRYIKDVVDQIFKIDTANDASVFCRPYDYVLEKFPSESERVSGVIEQEIVGELNSRS